jgi:uncharacterized membrane protein YoaK (UPF0700 family)
MAEDNFLREHGVKIVIALLLAFASGVVDIVGYRGVFHFFTAQLTGTTVQLGHSLVYGKRSDLGAAAMILAAFFAGSLLGRALIEFGSRKRIRRIASITLLIEIAFLATVAERFGSPANMYLSLAALAASMGIQTASLTGIGPLTVHTTFVTGMVNKLAQLVSHISFRCFDLWTTKTRSPEAARRQSQDIQLASFVFAVWVFYAGGAVLGTWSFEFWGLRALLVPIAFLVIGVATDQFRPLSIREEKEMSES